MGLATKRVSKESKEKVMSEQEKANFKGLVRYINQELTNARNRDELIDILTYGIRRINQIIKHEKSL